MFLYKLIKKQYLNGLNNRNGLIQPKLKILNHNLYKNVVFNKKEFGLLTNCNKEKPLGKQVLYKYLQIEITQLIVLIINYKNQIQQNKQKLILAINQKKMMQEEFFRQWLNMCMKQIFGNTIGLFSLCQTDETFYKFNLSQTILAQTQKNASLLGYLIGKALMEKVPIDCRLNYTIWRQILHQRIILDDIYSYDRQMYYSWLQILQKPYACEGLNFSIQMIDQFTKTSKSYHLIKNGDKKMVTPQNRQQYLKQTIYTYCVRNSQKVMRQLKKTLFSIIPFQYLSIFQPHQIDSLLCGHSTINLSDWRINTVYECFQQTDQIIKWFWLILQKLNQQMLKNLLHYTTGCSRVPITGFKYLQSNRNEIKKFTIRKISFDPVNPYPRSFTCFNRLQIPEYKQFDELQMAIHSICSQQINFINYQGNG